MPQLKLETLRDMLLGFAGEPVHPDYSDPRYIPIREKRNESGFAVDLHGYPHNYEAWIHPNGFHYNAGYMGLRVQKGPALMGVTSLTFRVVAENAGMVYEYKFNFGTGQPPLEMQQGRGGNVHGERVHLRKVRCIDLVVLDLISLMLPPQFEKHRPPFRTSYMTRYKACISCGLNQIQDHWTVCDDCRYNGAVTTV